MPTGSSTETSESGATVTVSDTSGPGGTTQFVDIVISIDPGKVVPAAEPAGYTKYDPDKLSVWWQNVEILPKGSASRSFQVQRQPGDQYAGAVEVITVVTNKDGTYFNVERGTLCDSHATVRLDPSLLLRLRKAFIASLDKLDESVS